MAGAGVEDGGRPVAHRQNRDWLLEVTLKRLIEAQTDKIVGMLALLVAVIYGSLFLLGGVVLLIHLWLAWWLSFLITGSAIVSAGVFFQIRMSAAAKEKNA